MDMERNLKNLKTEQNFYQRYQNTIRQENEQLVYKARLKEEKLKLQMRRAASKQSTARGIKNSNQQSFGASRRSYALSERS